MLGAGVTTPLLQVHELTKHFPITGGPAGIRTIGQVRAVDGVSFDLAEGETLLGLFDPLYAHEFLAFVGRMFGLDEATTRKRVTELLDALELTDTGKTLAEYSTGMRKRVAFAAAVMRPARAPGRRSMK